MLLNEETYFCLLFTTQQEVESLFNSNYRFLINANSTIDSRTTKINYIGYENSQRRTLVHLMTLVEYFNFNR